MNILLTGSSGYIGRNLINHPFFKNHQLFFLTRKNSGIKSERHFQDGTVDELSNILSTLKIDGIVHLASFYIKQHTSHDVSNLIESNIEFPTRLIEAAKNTNVKWFINTGTLWQNFKSSTYDPVNLYASTKQAFQDILKFYEETTKIKIVTLKLGDTFGPNDDRPKILNLLIESNKNKKHLGMSQGEQLVNLLYIEDVTNGFCQLVDLLSRNSDKLKNNEYCLQACKTLSLKELVNVTEKVLNLHFDITWGFYKYREREVMSPPNNIPLLPEWKPNNSLEEGIKKAFFYF